MISIPAIPGLLQEENQVPQVLAGSPGLAVAEWYEQMEELRRASNFEPSPPDRFGGGRVRLPLFDP